MRAEVRGGEVRKTDCLLSAWSAGLSSGAPTCTDTQERYTRHTSGDMILQAAIFHNTKNIYSSRLTQPLVNAPLLTDLPPTF